VTVRVAAAGDIHVGRDTNRRLAAALDGIDQCADLLLLAGDLTQVGSEEEASCVVAELADVPIPIVAVLGNHDYHADQAERVVGVLSDAGIRVLEGDSAVVRVGDVEVGVAGVKGFCGGFPGRSASEFGEPIMREFVGHTVAIARQLERALHELEGDVRLALLHYSPVVDTLIGEPPEIHPFLGSYLLAEAIDRTEPDLVLHGHAHRGSERGVTPGGVRVRNVAQPVLRAPFRVYELPGPRHDGDPTRHGAVRAPA
jgi:Icc-related predicted phosphoesterase